ncbi:DUF6247 family protein [Actinomadura adrarensis]|uniref:DUF6247 family protein n=1 Tax=Actinomadura adrarensis TaxID=1819600 RepID=A0ABW3CR36_9ACTN
MSAQPVHEEPDPQDPAVILGLLPERERATFRREYRKRVLAAADDMSGYRDLQAFLHRWALRARLLEQRLREEPDYYETLAHEAAAIRAGTVTTVPIEEALAEALGISADEAEALWTEKVAAARAARQNRA